MIRIIGFFILAFAALLSVSAMAEETNARFTLTADKIAAWKEPEGDEMVHITLTQAAKEDFADLTRANIGKPLDIYLEHVLLFSPIVQTPIEGGVIIFNYDSQTKPEMILPLLPAEKKTAIELPRD